MIFYSLLVLFFFFYIFDKDGDDGKKKQSAAGERKCDDASVAIVFIVKARSLFCGGIVSFYIENIVRVSH